MSFISDRKLAAAVRIMAATQISMLLALVSPSAAAGLVQIDFAASGGGLGPDATGQFVLDSDVPWTVNGGFTDVVVSGWFEVGGFLGIANVDSAFTTAVAGDTSTLSAIEIFGDYGPQLFGLSLRNNDAWFPSANPFDVLAPGLSIDDLDPYVPGTSSTTSFFYFETAPFTSHYLELTSISVSEVGVIPEPLSLGLVLIGATLLIGFRWARPRLQQQIQ